MAKRILVLLNTKFILPQRDGAYIRSALLYCFSQLPQMLASYNDLLKHYYEKSILCDLYIGFGYRAC